MAKTCLTPYQYQYGIIKYQLKEGKKMETLSTGDVIGYTIIFTIFGIALLTVIVIAVKDRMNFVTKNLKQTNLTTSRNNQKLETLYNMIENRYDFIVTRLDSLDDRTVAINAKVERLTIKSDY